MARRSYDDWFDLFRALGNAFFAVLRSEWEILKQRWGKSAKELGVAVGLFGGAAICGAVGLILVLVTLILVLNIWLEPWQSGLAVTAFCFVAAAVLALVGRWVVVSRFENPVESAKQRLGEHVTWWRHRLLQEVETLPEGGENGD